MTTRTLVQTTSTFRLYDVFNDLGQKIGQDREFIPDSETANLLSLTTKARQALTANSNFLAIASPTNAQILNQVQLLTRECNGIIRLLLNQLDTTTDT